MTLLEAIEARHSVRKYIDKPLAADVLEALQSKIDEVNAAGDLHLQLVTDEAKAFTGVMSYGKFSGVTNYIVVAGRKADDLEERAGYYGEQLVLLAQTLVLNTCWVGLTYRKVDNTFVLDEGEKVLCFIAIGYGLSQGVDHKRKSVEQLSNASDTTPEWFRRGVEAARLAPTAINQQKFHFEYIPAADGAKPVVKATRKFSMVGYTHIDLGIAKCHFELAAGKENFTWG